MSNEELIQHDDAQNFEMDEKALSTVQDRLNAFADKHDPSSDSTAATPVETPEVKPAESEGDSKPEDTVSDESPISDPVKDDEITLPDAYRRAAIHQEWTAEEVDAFFERDPVLALKTFEKIHSSTNAISRQLADLGQPIVMPPKAEPEKASSEPTQSDIDLNELEKEYADDPILDIIKKLVTQNRTTQSELADLKARPAPSTQTGHTAEQTTLINLIDTFFEDKALMPADYYGSDKHDWDDLTPNQRKRRDQVTITADQMIAGATAQGRELDNSTALAQAHLLESASSIKTSVIKEIKTTLEQRARGIDFKPGAGPAKDTDANDDKSEASMLQRTRERMRKIWPRGN